MPSPPVTEHLSSAEVCDLVGFDRSTLSRWVALGWAKPAHRLPGKTGALLFTRAEARRLQARFAETRRAS